VLKNEDVRTVIKTRPACLSSEREGDNWLISAVVLRSNDQFAHLTSSTQPATQRNQASTRDETPPRLAKTSALSHPTPRLAVQRHRHLRRPRRHTLSIVFVACHCLWRVGVVIQ
jgi:hypothetical protein